MKEIAKLRRKFVFYNMLIVTAVIGMAMTAGSLLFGRQIQEEGQRTLARAVEMETGEGQTGEETGRIFSSGTSVRIPYFTVLVEDGGTVRLLDGLYNSFPEGEYLERVANRGMNDQAEQGTLEDYHLRFKRVKHPSGVLLAFADTSYEDSIKGGLGKNMLLLCGGAWLCFLGLSTLFARWAVKPVEESMRLQKQFVADASHELKTPLTILSANAELLKNRWSGLDAETDRWMGNMAQECRQMRSLVENLLQLARQDGTQTMIWKQEFISLSDLATEELLVFEPVFFQQGRSLDGEIEDGLMIRGDAGQLGQLFKILLDNAVKYSEPGTETKVALKRCSHGRRIRLTVTSKGTPIIPELQKDIFRRFSRGGMEGREKPGHGLGLSIAEGIVRRHRGTIGVETLEDGNSFFVMLPVRKHHI